MCVFTLKDTQREANINLSCATLEFVPYINIQNATSPPSPLHPCRFLLPLHVLPSTKCARSVAEISGLAVTSTPPTASSEAPVLFPSATLQLLDQFGKPWMREHAPEPPAPLHFDLSGGRGDPEGDKDATRGGAPGYMPRVIVSARVDTMSSIAMSKSVGPVSLGGITRATADEYGRVKFGELSLLTDAGGIHSVVFTAVIVEAKPNSGRGHRGDDDDNAKTNGGGGIFRHLSGAK